jgi:hypothetical protein
MSYYEVYGSGHPLLLFAPGGLRSQLEFWRYSPSNPSAPPPWTGGGSQKSLVAWPPPNRRLEFKLR